MKTFSETMAELAARLPRSATQYVIPHAAGPMLPRKLDGRDLPDSFLAVVDRYDFSGRSLGPVNFFNTPRQSYAQYLAEANVSESSPFIGVLKDGGLFQVAAIEADPICIGAKGASIGEGAVGFVDVSTSTEFRGTRLCDTFEQFLVIVSSLFLNRIARQVHLNAEVYRKNALSSKALSFFQDKIA